MTVTGINWYWEEQISRVKTVRWTQKERLWWAVKKNLWGVVFLIVVLLITGCGTKRETAEQAVVSAFQALKKRDTVQIQRYFPEEESILELRSDVPQDDEVLEALLNRLECNVISSSVSGDNAIVKAEVKNVDFGAVFEEWFGMAMVMAFADAFSEESSSSTNNTDELLLNMLKRDDNKMRTAIIDVRLRQVNNAWILDTTDSEEMRDAIFGGMMTSLEIMANTFK
jgi:hypothetical protein